MDLEIVVQEAFSAEGVLSRAVDHFVPRSGQAEMAVAVAHAIENAEVLVVEASTGVGKTFSYLVPALLSGERVLVSTATKALQDQLFGRDLPRLISALGVPVSTALLKGRASYLCLHRMELAFHDANLSDVTSTRALSRIQVWSHTTRTGDMAELSGLDERSPLLPFVTSTRDNCLGAQCPKVSACHVNLARREALAADVVVVNHHLFFADLAVRESGVAELLPTVRIAIFDEAHQLNETGVQFLGQNLSTGQLLDFCRDLLAAGLQLARGLVDWLAVVGYCEQAARELRLCAGQQAPGAKLLWTATAPEQLDPLAWRAALLDIHQAFEQACEVLLTVSEIAADFVRLHDRATELSARALKFSQDAVPGCVRWVDVGLQLRLVESPLTIADAVKTRMLEPSALDSSTPALPAKSWIFTSATLGDDAKLSWFTEPCGLSDARILRIGSPFDYASQAALYVPLDFPKPGDAAHPASVAQSAAAWASRLGGRTMVLTTSLRSLKLIAQALQTALAPAGEIEVLTQGEMPKRVLVERFRQGSAGGQRGCILVASASFWEGIDVPGESLQLLIIDKLPFPPPNDPMSQARSKALEAEGKSAFNKYFLPEAAVALKQGAGRLIRRESDHGVLVVCDPRLGAMGYGKRLLKALPPMQRLESQAQLEARLDQLTKICTTL